jgi:hypothetical protein
VTEYGLEKVGTYENADELARSLLLCCEQAPAEMRAAFREFRVGQRAEILFLTYKHWESQQAAGTALVLACMRAAPLCSTYALPVCELGIRRSW